MLKPLQFVKGYIISLSLGTAGSAWLWARHSLSNTLPSALSWTCVLFVLGQRRGLTRPSISGNAEESPAEDRVSLISKLQTTASRQGCFWLCGKTISFSASLAGLGGKPPASCELPLEANSIQPPACSWQPITITISLWPSQPLYDDLLPQAVHMLPGEVPELRGSRSFCSNLTLPQHFYRILQIEKSVRSGLEGRKVGHPHTWFGKFCPPQMPGPFLPVLDLTSISSSLSMLKTRVFVFMSECDFSDFMWNVFFSSPGHILPRRHFGLQERGAHSCHLEKMQGVVVTAKVHTHGERLDVCLQERIGYEGGEIQGAAALLTSFQSRLTLLGISPLLCSLSPCCYPICALTTSAPSLLCPALAHHSLFQPHDSLHLPTWAQTSSSLR